MIEIKFYEKDERYGIKATGHAEYAAHGQDIVCAAVSTILQGLGNYIDRVADNYNWKVLEIKLEPGDINVEFINQSVTDYCFHMFHMVKCTLLDLADMYPANIRSIY